MKPKSYRKISLILTVVLVLSCFAGIPVYAGNGGHNGMGNGCRQENQYRSDCKCGVCGICDPDCDGIPDRDRLRDCDGWTLSLSGDSDCDGTQKKDMLRDRINWTEPV